MVTARIGHSATLLGNGTVLIAGGTGSSYASLASAEIYDPATETFSASGNLNASRSGQTATLLNNGTVLLAGGFESSGSADPTLASAEVYQPASSAVANLVSVAVAPAAPSIAAGTAQRFTATGTFSDNSTEVLSSVVWTSSDNTVATVTNDSTNRGAAFGVAAGSATLTGCAGSICGSTTLTVSTGALAISGLSPSAGNVGTPVIIGGTGFGASQGNSTVTFNGTPAAVQLWSATGIVVTVPSGATTGDVVVTVGGVNSNGVLFTVSPSPVITGLSPTEGFAGTAVTISGANFGASQGSSTVTFNGLPATATSWSDSSIAVTVPAGATTGDVVVTVSGVPSNGVGFEVGSTITGITPISGPIGTLVTINGGGFGTTQGSGVAAINGIPMQVVDWSDTEIHASVATGTTTGAVSVRQGGVVLSGTTFTVSSAFPYTVSPQVVNLVVGQSQKISAPTGLQWITTNSSVVSLSTDDPPVLTGVGVGSATVYAGAVPISVTVYEGALPPGTPSWSIPSIPGMTTQALIQAIPTANGPDLYTLDSGGSGQSVVRAFQSDGEMLWQQSVSEFNLGYGPLTSDGSGGVLLTSEEPSGALELDDLDPQNGQMKWQYAPTGGAIWSPAVGPDGTVYALEDDYDGQNDAALDTIDASSGTVISRVTSLPTFTESDTLNTPVYSYDQSGQPHLLGYYYCASPSYYYPTPQGDSGRHGDLTSAVMVGPDGTVYVEAEASQQTITDTTNSDGTCTDVGAFNEELVLITLSPGGGSQTQQLASFSTTWTNTYAEGANCPSCVVNPVYLTGHSPGNVIPDGQGGVLATWTTVQHQASGTTNTVTVADIGPSGGGQVNMPLNQLPPGNDMVLSDTGTAFITDGSTVVAFNGTSLATLWTYSSQGGQLSLVAASSDGGVVISDSIQGILHLDANGQATSVPTGMTLQASTTGDWYESGSSGTGPVTLPVFADLASPWFMPAGEPQKQSAANPTAKITVNFSGNLSSGDNLVFATGPNDPACSQALGLFPCLPKDWVWNVEVAATVSDDASKWTARQTATGQRSGYWKDPQGALHSFQDSFSTKVQANDDNPCAAGNTAPCNGDVSLQQQPGQKSIFWIDDPATTYPYNFDPNTGTPYGFVDSVNSSEHFTSKVCNRFGICTKTYWFVDIIVDPGASLDTGLSAAGPAASGP